MTKYIGISKVVKRAPIEVPEENSGTFKEARQWLQRNHSSREIFISVEGLDDIVAEAIKNIRLSASLLESSSPLIVPERLILLPAKMSRGRRVHAR